MFIGIIVIVYGKVRHVKKEKLPVLIQPFDFFHTIIITFY